MKVIRVPKFIKAVPGILISGLLFGMLILFSAPQPAQAATPVCIQPLVCVTIPGPTVTLPRATVTVPTRITLPRATVTQPAVVKTVTKRIPGPVSTVTLIRDAPQKTATVTSTQTVSTGQTGRESARVSTVTATTTVTATRTDVRTVNRDRVVNLTKPGAVGISLGLIGVGVLLTLLVLYIMYRLGYMRAEDQNIEDWKDLRDSLNTER